MVLSQEYLTAVSGTHGDSHVRPLEMEIVNLKRQVQMNKQSIGQHKSQIENGIEAVRPGDVSKINCTILWSFAPGGMIKECIFVQVLLSQCILLWWWWWLFFTLKAVINFSQLNSECKTKTLQKFNKLLEKHYKTLNIQTSFDVRYLNYNHRKQLQGNIETFTMPSTREKEKKIQQWLRHKCYM